ncbi:MAG: hypothetical protein ACREPR_21790 [Brasilonema sp.]
MTIKKIHIQDLTEKEWEKASDSEHMYGLFHPAPFPMPEWIQYLRRYRPHIEGQYKNFFTVGGQNDD